MFLLLPLFSYCINYEENGNTLTISGEGEINQKGVRSKGNYKTLETIIINEGPTRICDLSFSECAKIKSISIPASVVSIGAAFFRNYVLETITVAAGNNKYYVNDDGILIDKDNMMIVRVPAKQVSIPEGIKKIGKYAFGVGHGFRWNEIVFPSTLVDFDTESLNEARFTNLSFAKNATATYLYGFTYSTFGCIYIPASCKEIKSRAFYGSTIWKIIFEEISKLKTIETQAFAYLKSNTLFNLPDSLETIKDNAFQESTRLQTIVIGKNCSAIQSSAFTGCTSLVNLTISSENEEFSSFEGIIMDKEKTKIIFIPPGLTSLTLADSIKEIGETLLQSQKQLTSIVLQSNKTYATQDGVLYSQDFTTLYFVCGGVTSVNAHENLTTINKYAAAFCNKLCTFSFKGAKITEIKERAFFQSGLTTFALPDTIEVIGEYAFSECENLTEFNISENSNLADIKGYAFRNSKLALFYLPPKLTAIGYEALCASKITTLLFDADSVINTLSSRAFSSLGIQSINLPKSLTLISSGCLSSCTSLANVVFPDDSKLTEIQSDAFSNCISLTQFNLPRSCKVLGQSAFSGCTSLHTFTQSSLTDIQSLCFNDCSRLSTFYISEEIASININTFTRCTSLTRFSVSENHPNFKEIDGVVFDKTGETLYLYPPGLKHALISKSATSIRQEAFSGCSILMSVIFESGSKMETFGRSAFLSCVSLVNILFPPLLSKIETDCFRDCRSLKIVSLPSELETIESGAFMGCNKLQIIKYCGTNEITGTEVFPTTLKKVFVTIYYTSEELCSLQAIHGLTTSCELPDYLISNKVCRQKRHSLLYLFVVMLK